MLAAFIRRFSLPLLAKDLVETANRRRTYVMRVIYAALLYGFSLLAYVEDTNALRQSAIDLLGSGRSVLLPAILLQFAGICLFMPALSVGAITVEKERNTLTLLFLTRLGPWTIVFEKYLARVVNMLSYLLISLPLFGLAYSLGGITQLEIWAGIWMLILMTAQVGAIAIACSAYFHSTTAAFIWTYIIGAGLYLFPAILAECLGWRLTDDVLNALTQVCNVLASKVHGVIASLVQPALIAVGCDPLEVPNWFAFQPIDLVYGEDASLWTCPLNVFVSTVDTSRMGTGAAYWHVAVRTPPILVTIGFHLLLARYWLVRRAAATGGNRIMAILKWVDQFFHRINQNRFTQGKVLIQDTQPLPEDHPIAWRETKKRAFGTVRYLVRFLLLIEFPTAVLCLLVVLLSDGRFSRHNRSEVLAVLSMLLWGLSTLFLISKAATVLPSERLRETFDVLLSTPMSMREIVRQKYAGVSRLIWVLSIPLATVVAAHATFIQSTSQDLWNGENWVWYLIGMGGATLIYPRMIAWLSILVGLLVKSQTKAIFITLSILLIWIVAPIACLAVWDEILGMRLVVDEPIFTMMFSQSPAFLIFITETAEEPGAIIVAVLTSLFQYGVITYCLRAACLGSAARLLGRPETR
jgi:ABC-type transport system involved in multi-copper enzyme maturation permease subunit